MMILTEQITNDFLFKYFLFLLIAFFWSKKDIKDLIDVIKGKKKLKEWNSSGPSMELVYSSLIFFFMMCISWIYLVIRKMLM